MYQETYLNQALEVHKHHINTLRSMNPGQQIERIRQLFSDKYVADVIFNEFIFELKNYSDEFDLMYELNPLADTKVLDRIIAIVGESRFAEVCLNVLDAEIEEAILNELSVDFADHGKAF